MGIPSRLALVPENVALSLTELTQVASALSKQVSQDFAPLWDVDATVDAFARLDEVPLDYWPVIVVPNVDGAAGYHSDENGQPFALVEAGPLWSLTASHETLEMLADPFGRRLKSGDLLPQAVALGVAPAKVSYLVEVCDPCESEAFAYQVNGVLVSDFYTTRFFDPVAAPNTSYSFTGAVDAPRTVLDGGYVSWEDLATGHWMQLRMFADDLSAEVPHVVDLTTQTPFEELRRTTSLRSAVDRVTPHPMTRAALPAGVAARVAAKVERGAAARAARATSLRAAIAALRGG